MTAIQQATKSTLTLSLSLLMLCTYPVLAADHGPKAATTQASSVIHHQLNNDAEVAPVKIYGNLGPTDDLYDARFGYWVSGPDNVGPFPGLSQDIAMPFTPVQDSTVTRVKVALQYYNFGGGQTNGALLAIYDDANGLPGSALAKRRRGNFDDYGSGCCDLALWTLTSPLPVKAGVQYWVVGTTDKKTRDSVNTWDFVFDDAPGTFAFQQANGGWVLLNASLGYSLPAVAVRGTAP